MVLADGLSGLSRSRRSCHVRRETDERFVARRVVRHMAAMGCAVEASILIRMRCEMKHQPKEPASVRFLLDVCSGGYYDAKGRLIGEHISDAAMLAVEGRWWVRLHA